MDLLDPRFLMTVMLVFVRIGGLLVTAPLFRQTVVPVQLKILLSVLLAYVLSGLVMQPLPPHIFKTAGFVVAIGIEALTGLLIGLAAQFVFWAVQFAGEVLGFQMGLAMAKVFNPVSGVASNPLGRMLGLAVLIVFILVDGHHHVIRALVYSFDAVPLAGANLYAPGPLLLEWMGDFFRIALRLSSPFMITIFLIDATLGVFARVAPQADLFSIALPVKLLVGLGLFYFFLQELVPYLPDLVDLMVRQMYDLINAMGTTPGN